MFYIMARTGLRLGEATGLQWDDPDFSGRQIRIIRAISNDGKRIEMPKSGRSRLVDMSASVRDLLLRLDAARKEDALRQGVPVDTLPAWVFHTRGGRPLDHSNVERAFKRVVKAARLPLHLTPHSLRTVMRRSCSSRASPLPTSRSSSATPPST
jgi:integrase